MSNLFYTTQKPLAERMRPQRLEDIVGQTHLVGEEGVLRNIISTGTLSSIIFWGPPGVGKTTLARILSRETGMQFYTLSAIQSGVKDIRSVIAKAENLGNAVLFIDEIHRFNKSQQDALLGAVESGTIILIGATTENPSFELNSALLSRAQVMTLKPLEKKELQELADKVIREDDILRKLVIEIQDYEALLRLSDGDARKLLNLIELVVQSSESEHIIITDEAVLRVADTKMALYDKTGEQHYDIISAFIKSVRGSEPQAAVYWLARMLEGGEDIKFIARRLVILAAEDIGLANPNALVLANSTFDAINKIGMPEARIILSECTIYLATSAKSNSAYEAIDKAIAQVRASGNLPVPMHLRNAPTQMMKDMDYGKDYKYAHSYDQNFVQQQYLPDELAGQHFYDPGTNTREKEIKKWLDQRWGTQESEVE